MTFNFTNNSYNFTKGNEVIGISIDNANKVIDYNFLIDLELITIILIIIMFCEIARTTFLFLRYIGLIKRD